MNNPARDMTNLFEKVCDKRNLDFSEIGKTGKQRIILISNKDFAYRKNLLIVAGVHGDEPAGTLGIFNFLEQADKDILGKCNLYLIPIMSPICFGKRHNSYTRTNCGYVPGMLDKLSVEGRFYAQIMGSLKAWSSDGFLSLHETLGETHFGMYIYGESYDHIQTMRSVGNLFFPLMPEGEPTGECGGKFFGGTCFYLRDGSLEHALWKMGCPLSVSTETPGKASLESRIECNSALVETFIKLRGGMV